MMIGIYFTGSGKSNYHTIMTTTAPVYFINKCPTKCQTFQVLMHPYSYLVQRLPCGWCFILITSICIIIIIKKKLEIFYILNFTVLCCKHWQSTFILKIIVNCCILNVYCTFFSILYVYNYHKYQHFHFFRFNIFCSFITFDPSFL